MLIQIKKKKTVGQQAHRHAASPVPGERRSQPWRFSALLITKINEIVMSRLEKVSKAGKAFLQALAGHVKRCPCPVLQHFQNFVFFCQIIHEYSLTIKMITVIDKNTKKVYYLNFSPTIMFSCFLKNSNINKV